MSQPEFRTFIDSLWLLFTKGIRYSTIIDVGCADGQFFLQLFDQGVFTGAVPLNIDANALYEESLRAIQEVVGGHYRICAVTDHVGHAEITNSVHPYWSSLRPEGDPYWERVNKLSATKSMVSATTLDTLRKELGLRPPFLLKLDVQGSEKSALQGAAELLEDTSVVICEADIDDFQDVNLLLREKDFILYDVTALNYATEGTLGWFYPVYINQSLNSIRPKSFWDTASNDNVIAQHIERRESILKSNAEILARIRNSRETSQSSKLKSQSETISRNALCPCGSGRKYKQCCGAYVNAPRLSADANFRDRELVVQSRPLRISLSNHVTLAVPPRLDSTTTYVLLEQEMWYEKELSFLSRWLKPGMTAIDIGAHLGVYALPIARLVGPRGCVFAYEPGSEARKFLQQSRDINLAYNLEIFELALSDSEREGRLLAGPSSELNALGEVGSGELVQITNLDIQDRKRGWDSPDFIKIDAEGEEERILTGGRDFFARHSPLIMFEIKVGAVINENLQVAVPAMGYQLFRLLVGTPILVPIDPRLPLDPFELNLFACKPDRVRSLRDEDLLVDQFLNWEPNSEAISGGLSLIRRQAFAPMFGHLLDDAKYIDPDYAEALAAFAVWRTNHLSARTRCTALFFAYQTLAAVCKRAPTTARYSTLARLAWEGGWRGECVTALKQMAAYILRVPFKPTEPCWPANPRFDDITVGDDPAIWFATAVAEQLERAESFSTCFSGMSPWLAWLCDQSAASHEMHRRKTLLAARGGVNPVVPSCLRKEAPDHLNSNIWRSGMVPGTRVIP